MNARGDSGIAVVTGASTGIGYSTALRLARDGHHVVAAMRRPDASDLPEVTAVEGLSLEVATVDVDSDDSVDALFAAVRARHGHVDVLVANAGVGGGTGTVEMVALADFRSTMETNYFGTLRCVKAVLPSMRERTSGSIVVVTSQAGRIATPMLATYVGSKWALEGAMEALAISVSPFGIRVAIIEPGCILTPIFGKGDLGDVPPHYQAPADVFVKTLTHDLGRGSDPSVVADCISAAITTDSPQLRYLVGQGAERNIAFRASMTDQEYVELSLLPVDEQVARLLGGEV